ncbi:MAG: hypothetical protein ACTHPD_05635 [Rhizomicrobium sp.]
MAGFIGLPAVEVKAAAGMFLRMGRKISIRRAVATDADETAALFSAEKHAVLPQAA